jgi:flavin-dependent dehydrogenase
MDADVVVIGGGPVGAALAMFLGKAGRRVIVLEKSRFPRDKPCGEGLMPSGVRVLHRLGVDLAAEGFPAVDGVRYRLPGGNSARGSFRSGPGCGVRRVRLDALLAERAAATPGVRLLTGCGARGIAPERDCVRVEADGGELRAPVLVGADGIRSQVARWLGLALPPGGTGRYALVGHVGHEGRPWDEIVVSLLGGVEVYAAPSGPGEVLAAVLGARGSLRRPAASVTESYRAIVAEAHPELEGAPLTGRVWGAGPFRLEPARVAQGRAFLVGDAAGFLDPLTGDGMAAGLGQAEALAGFLLADAESAGPRYAAWRRRQWRRRRFVTGLALALSGSATLARRAVAGVGRRPSALQSLLELNDGTRGLRALGPRDWAALAGF